jgi:hypothetical protein
MKRKKPSFARFKPVPHAVPDRSKSHAVERHVEVHGQSGGRVGGSTTYRKGPTVPPPPRNNTDGNPQAPAPPSSEFDATFNCDAFDRDAPASPDGMQPEKVRDIFSCTCKARSDCV